MDEKTQINETTKTGELSTPESEADSSVKDVDSGSGNNTLVNDESANGSFHANVETENTLEIGGSIPNWPDINNNIDDDVECDEKRGRGVIKIENLSGDYFLSVCNQTIKVCETLPPGESIIFYAEIKDIITTQVIPEKQQ